MSDPEQMYRLHRYFSEIELQRTYDEIAKLQVSRFPGVTNLTGSVTKTFVASKCFLLTQK